METRGYYFSAARDIFHNIFRVGIVAYDFGKIRVFHKAFYSVYGEKVVFRTAVEREKQHLFRRFFDKFVAVLRKYFKIRVVFRGKNLLRGNYAEAVLAGFWEDIFLGQRENEVVMQKNAFFRSGFSYDFVRFGVSARDIVVFVKFPFYERVFEPAHRIINAAADGARLFFANLFFMRYGQDFLYDIHFGIVLEACADYVYERVKRNVLSHRKHVFFVFQVQKHFLFSAVGKKIVFRKPFNQHELHEVVSEVFVEISRKPYIHIIPCYPSRFIF